jgi:hypothetical protein
MEIVDKSYGSRLARVASISLERKSQYGNALDKEI